MRGSDPAVHAAELADLVERSRSVNAELLMLTQGFVRAVLSGRPATAGLDRFLELSPRTTGRCARGRCCGRTWAGRARWTWWSSSSPPASPGRRTASGCPSSCSARRRRCCSDIGRLRPGCCRCCVRTRAGSLSRASSPAPGAASTATSRGSPTCSTTRSPPVRTGRSRRCWTPPRGVGWVRRSRCPAHPASKGERRHLPAGRRGVAAGVRRARGRAPRRQGPAGPGRAAGPSRYGRGGRRAGRRRPRRRGAAGTGRSHGRRRLPPAVAALADAAEAGDPVAASERAALMRELSAVTGRGRRARVADMTPNASARPSETGSGWRSRASRPCIRARPAPARVRAHRQPLPLRAGAPAVDWDV